GFGANFEQSITADVRIGARTGWNEGEHESFAYTEVNDTLAGGIDVAGTRGRRSSDRIGVAIVSDGLAPGHRRYLRLGGLGFLLGDGTLRYGRETIVEGYYAAALGRGMSISGGVQRVDHPGYNRDRGPFSAVMARLHVDF